MAIYEKFHTLEDPTKINLADSDEKLKIKPQISIKIVSVFTWIHKKDYLKNEFIYNPKYGKTYYFSIFFLILIYFYLKKVSTNKGL